MSGAAQGNTATTKAVVSDSTNNNNNGTTPSQTPKAAAQLEEDDEFEDFPVEDWSKEEEVGAQTHNTHLWEESWDDDDTTDDFSVQLKDELKKMESSRKG